MVEKATIRFQCGVVCMAKTDASEGALEAGKFSVRVRRAEHHHSKRM